MTVAAIRNGQGNGQRSSQWNVNKISSGKNGVKNTTESSYQLLMQQAMMVYRK